MLATSESVVCEIGEADKCRASDSSNDDDLCNLAAKIVTFNGAKASASRTLKEFDGESKKFEQRFWTTCSTSKNLERGT